MKFFRKKEQRPQISELPEIFTYSYAMINLHKGAVPSCNINGLNYELIAANSFIKLRTEKGLKYWMSQAEQGRREPDWKIHFAIEDEDIAPAWNIIARIFLDIGNEYIMKAKTHPPHEWPKHMHGREITVYVPVPCPPLGLTKQNVTSNKFWRIFIQRCENDLNKAQIGRRPIAEGDLPLGRYSSLRNEAFIAKTPDINLEEDCWEGYDKQLAISSPKVIQYIYPPNSLGYNAAQHDIPKFVQGLQLAQKIKGP